MRLFSLLVWFCLAFGGAAFAAPPAFDTFARNAILIDAKSGHVFFEKDADTAIPPASMSKLMTQAIVFDMVKEGSLKLTTEMAIGKNASKRGGAGEGSSTMFAAPGSSVTVDNLLRGAIIQSANDACIALAEGIAGTEPAFAQRMMQKGQELGLKNSNFTNATGLPDPAHRMSTRDLAILARYIITNHPDFYSYYGLREFTWSKITQQNRNPLLKDYPGVDGMKTGYTKEAGYGLVGSAERDGRRLILVVAGLESTQQRKLEAQKLLDYGFNQFKIVNLYEAGDKVTTARVWGGEERQVNLVAKEKFRIALAPFELENADLRVNYEGPLIAPIKAGTEVGRIHLMLGGKSVLETAVTVESDIAATSDIWRRAADSALMIFFGG